MGERTEMIMLGQIKGVTFSNREREKERKRERSMKSGEI